MRYDFEYSEYFDDNGFADPLHNNTSRGTRLKAEIEEQSFDYLLSDEEYELLLSKDPQAYYRFLGKRFIAKFVDA